MMLIKKDVCSKIHYILMGFFLLAIVDLRIAHAASLEDGRKAYLGEKYQKAMKILLPLANDNNAKAQELIAIMYDFGHGVDKDEAQALVWYERSAEQGNETLQHDLGIRYFKGDRVAKDYSKAAYWWRKAAESGVAESQYNLGLMLTQGLGIDKNQVEAITWYEKAAAQDHANAQYSLGIAHAFGQGVEVDYERAIGFFTMAARNGVAQAQYNLGILYENGRGADIDHDQAQYWFRKAAANGLAEAKQKIARLEQLDLGAKASVTSDFKPESKQAPVQAAQVPSGDSQKLVKQLSQQLQVERNRVAELSSELTEKLLEIEALEKASKNRDSDRIERDAELTALRLKLDGTTKNAEALSKQLQDQAAEMRELRDSVVTIEEEKSGLALGIQNRELEIQQLRAQLEDVSKATAGISEAAQLSARLAQDLEKLTLERDALQSQLAAARQQIGDLEEQNSIAERERIKMIAERSSNESGPSVAGELVEYASRVASLTQKLDSSKAEILALKGKIDLRQRNEQQLLAELEKQKGLNSALEQSLANAERTALDLNRADQLALANNNQQLEKALAAVSEERDRLAGELAQSNSKLNSLQFAMEESSVANSDQLTIARERETADQRLLEARDQEIAELNEKVRRLTDISNRYALLEAQKTNWEQERTVYDAELAQASQDIAQLKSELDSQSQDENNSRNLPMLASTPDVKINRYTSFAGKSDWGRNNRLFTEIHKEEWIKNQQPNHYLLQLITLPNEKLVKKFFDMYPLQEAEKAYFVSRKGNKEIYNIVYGVYQDRGAALRAVENLPEGIRKKEPIIRDFASIQRYVAGLN